MQNFPVTHSNLSAQHLIPYLTEKYDLPTPITCQFIRAGLNDTYLVKNNNQKYIFRVYSFQWRSKIEIQEELRFLNLLKANHISVSYPIADINQQFIQVLNAPEGERYGVLFSYAEGEKLMNYSNELHYKVGALMARMHQISKNSTLSRTTYTPKLLIEDSYKSLKKFVAEDSVEMIWMKQTQQYLQKEFANIDYTQLRKGIIHLDIWFDNLNITEEEKITLFDFDFCGNGWLCLDIAYYILQLHNIERDPTINQEKLDSFLQGYESITSISAEEKRILPMLGVSLYYFYLGGVQCERFDNWSNTFLSETYLKRYIVGNIQRYFNLGISK